MLKYLAFWVYVVCILFLHLQPTRISAWYITGHLPKSLLLPCAWQGHQQPVFRLVTLHGLPPMSKAHPVRGSIHQMGFTLVCMVSCVNAQASTDNSIATEHKGEGISSHKQIMSHTSCHTHTCLPVGDDTTCTLHHRHQCHIIIWFHVRFHNKITKSS